MHGVKAVVDFLTNLGEQLFAGSSIPVVVEQVSICQNLAPNVKSYGTKTSRSIEPRQIKPRVFRQFVVALFWIQTQAGVYCLP